MTSSRTNQIKYWILASRPKTLTGAVAPVMLGLCATVHDSGSILWIPAVLCILFAVLMQINANFINDYYDCVKGVDTEERLGPERACSQGWISLPDMRCGIALCTLLSALAGLPLILWGGYEMIIVGIACVIFCFLYTTLLSRYAMGDVLVVVFFGLVPVTCTYYLQTGSWNSTIVALALAQGLVTDCLLLVNNFRDRETDVQSGKITLVTIIGEKGTYWLYALCGIIPSIIAASILDPYKWPLLSCFLVFYMNNKKEMKRINRGKALNGVLAKSALSILLFAVLVSILLLLPSF